MSAIEPLGEPVDVAIVGAGMAGVAAALWCKRMALSCAWLETGADLGGQLARINGPIPDYPGLVAPDGRAFREALRAQVAAEGLAPRTGAAVVAADLAGRRLDLVDGTAFAYRGLVIATGARPRRLGVPGEEALRGRGVSDSATRDLARLAGKHVAVVGGGDAALENALILARAGCRVELLHRGAAFRGRPDFVAAVGASDRIAVHLGARVGSVLGEERVTGLLLAEGPALAVDAVVVKIGVTADLGPFHGQVALDAAGYVAVDVDQATSAAWAYAAGDVCNPRHSSLAAAAGQGMVAVKALATRLAGP